MGQNKGTCQLRVTCYTMHSQNLTSVNLGKSDSIWAKVIQFLFWEGRVRGGQIMLFIFADAATLSLAGAFYIIVCASSVFLSSIVQQPSTIVLIHYSAYKATNGCLCIQK